MMTRLLFALASLSLFAPRSLAQTLIFPHLADGYVGDGTRWATEIDVVNTSSSTQTATISLFRPNGLVKCVDFPQSEDLPSCPPFNLTLLPNAMRVLELDSAFPFHPTRTLETGWILVEGSGGIKGFVILRRLQYSLANEGGIVLQEAGFRPQPAVKTVDFIPRSGSLREQNLRDPFEIAYALANPDPLSNAVGEIQLFWSGGKTAASNFTIPPRGQIAEYANQRFGDYPFGAGQYFRIVMSSGTVSAIAIRFLGDVISPIEPQTDTTTSAHVEHPRDVASLLRQSKSLYRVGNSR